MIDRDYVVVVPAYGRDYKSASAAKAAFLLAKEDFRLSDYQYGDAYCSVRDFAPGVAVNIRYGRLMKVTTVKVPSR